MKLIKYDVFRLDICSKCSKTSNTRWIQKSTRQKVHTQIRLLLNKQSGQILP